MTKRQTHPNNGLDPSAQKRPQRNEERALARSDSTSPDHNMEAEELTARDVNDPSSEEDRGANDALMESYNG